MRRGLDLAKSQRGLEHHPRITLAEYVATGTEY
jgi:hypothetical protein